MQRVSLSAALSALVGLVLLGSPIQSVMASPPGGGGFGGPNVAGIVIGSIRAAQTVKSIRDANGGGGGAQRGVGQRGTTQQQQRQPTYTQPNYVQQPQQNVAPRTNVVPQQNVVPISPVANTGADEHLVQVSAADLARIKNELKDQNAALLNDLGRQLSAAIAGIIDKLPGAAALTPAQRTNLQNAIESGNPTAVSNLLTPADRNSPAGRDLTNLATARQQIDAVRTAVTNGNVSINDLINLLDAIDDALPRDAVTTVGQIAVIQQVTFWINTAQPGPIVIPPGNNVPIALVPGLPPGQILPLGPQVLIGMGPQGGRRIVLGEGNVLQVAGLPAPNGPPMPNYDGETFGQTVVLGNGGNVPMNYNVNQSPFEMKPEYTQNLGAGEWLVEFDRGGSFGLARYTLTEGYYEFTATEKGWDLFKQSFTTTLENGNDFEFHYVLDNKRHSLKPGAKVDLTGSFPIVLKFENGNGELAAKRLKSGVFKVAITEKTALDIYPAESIAAPPKPQQLLIGGAPTATLGLTAAVAPAAAAGEPAAVEYQLPPGFQPIDPVAALAAKKGKIAAGQKAAAFSLFASSGEE